jgi:hypothetical protein
MLNIRLNKEPLSSFVPITWTPKKLTSIDEEQLDLFENIIYNE